MTDLIKTVRGLDQSGPGERGENLDHLWKTLTDSSDKQFHAAEESSLRWLLKSMNGSTEAAETLRRFPMAWRLLGCVFQRIPLFSLAKSLADRRFLAVLQQTVKEVSTSTPDSGTAKSSKRKRSQSADFSLDSLRSIDGRIESTQAIFTALVGLLNRIDDPTLIAAHDKIGAEHLTSLFGTSTKDAVSTTVPLLRMCDLIFESQRIEDIVGCKVWVATTLSIWAMHLQESDDVGDVGVHIFPPASRLLAKVDDLGSEQHSSLKEQWSSDLRKFLHTSLMFPVRSAFVNRSQDDVMVNTLEAAQGLISVAAPTFYLLAATAVDTLTQRGVRKGNAEWMKRVFQVVVAALSDENGTHTATIKHVLKLARERSTPVDTNDLRAVYRQFATNEEGTDWDLLANLARCDPDIFQGGDEGSELLKDVTSKSLAEDAVRDDNTAVSEVIGAIANGFRTARDFSSFLKLWFEQLCAIERQKLQTSSAWLSIGRETSTSQFDCKWVEQDLSIKQLTDLLDWVEAQEVQPKALSIWLNAVSQGVQRDDYKDATADKLFASSLKITKSNTEITALKWRTVAKSFAWGPLTNRAQMWSQIQKPLGKILKKASTNSAETFEAFKCCCRVWVTLSPDGDEIAEAAKMVADFTTRLHAELASNKFVDDSKLPTYLGLETEYDFKEDASLQQYIAWYLRGSSRLTKLYYEKKAEVLPTVHKAMSHEEAELLGLEAVWNGLLENEQCIDQSKLAEDILNQAIDALDDSKKQKSFPQKLWTQLLSGIHLDAITRSQRERTMTTLIRVYTSSKIAKKASIKDWKMMLSLSTSLMSRPTFYEDMRMQHLIDLAATLSKVLSDLAVDDDNIEEMVHRTSQMSTATIKQMADHADERSVNYFAEGAAFVAKCKKDIKNGKAQELPSLYLTLLKSLVIGLTQSPNHQSNTSIASLTTDATAVLGSLVAVVFGEWVSDKSLFSKPTSAADLRLLAAVDAAGILPEITELQGYKSSSLSKLETRSLEAMRAGQLRGWKMQTFLQKHLSEQLEMPRPASFRSLSTLPSHYRISLLTEYVGSIVKTLDSPILMLYLESLIGDYNAGNDTDGQLHAIHHVVDQLIKTTEPHGREQDYDLSAAQSELTRALVTAKTRGNSDIICQTIHALLERKPQAMSQWNIESLLQAVSTLASGKPGTDCHTRFSWLCKLVEVTIKKHRLRLEGHYHILLSALQPLLRSLMREQRDGESQALNAGLFGRLISLVCEPTTGAVSGIQHNSVLDSATDAAKRSAGRHMYLILMQYVKLQLETDVSRPVRDALEPAVNSIFDITPPEGRKILNDAMDASGRAILREMFKQYTRHGKWSGV